MGNEENTNVIGPDLRYGTSGAVKLDGDGHLLEEGVLPVNRGLVVFCDGVSSKASIVQLVRLVHQDVEAIGVGQVPKGLVVSRLQDVGDGCSCSVALLVEEHDDPDRVGSFGRGLLVYLLEDVLVPPVDGGDGALAPVPGLLSNSLGNKID